MRDEQRRRREEEEWRGGEERRGFVVASGKWEEMIRASLKRNQPLCLLRADFFLSFFFFFAAQLTMFQEVACYFNKREDD